jgi:pimeloyl-ACP methyl ester carboxylesterase
MPSLSRALSRDFVGPAHTFRVTTADGIGLSGTRVGEADPAIVLCHGFSGWHRKPRPARFADALARWFTVYGFDFRGHGQSEGFTTFGVLEVNDIEAIVRRAHDEGHSNVATVGASMGGIAVVRHAALVGGVDAVVSISTPARWDGHRSAAVRRMTWLTSSASGRRLMRAAGVRLPDTWERPESPEDLVGKIAPTPLLLVHGRDDHFFDEEEAWRLYRRAGSPKRLLLARPFGHADDGFTDELAQRVARFVYEAWGLPWPA